MIMKAIVCFLIALAASYCAAADISQTDLQKVMNDLWQADANRANENQVQIDYQSHTNTGDRVDAAPRKLFKNVDPALLKKPTYQALADLFSGYSADVSAVDATKTNEFKKKVDTFLNAMNATGPFQVLQKFLATRGLKAASNSADFRKFLADLWFSGYGRAPGAGGSSGFEHVFVGEVKDNEVSGMHSWVRLYFLESRNQLDYTGFVIKRPRVAMVQFVWGNVWKPSGSIFIGTSPEFDFAVYTICFLTKPGRNACTFVLGDCTPIEVTSYDYKQNGNTYIGTVFPSPGRGEAKCP